ncbi:probable E3 SUMO-protein ligase RNF212 isoform X1 [Xenopus tropicalis]|uniref:Probable E3 SUMO-protein ligase RNF212 isoform X1 n=1 Tax=Xenopus tropicalis TaxID=8364 RepID=A0A8J1J2A3_XENTR|nr:probable E3 SUMO-protein ligase RNF212 isoform X1 [Xenopus tropicalis]
MSGLAVLCNVCFQKPVSDTTRYALTSCGHVVCEHCLQKGKKEECTVCRTSCRIIFLSNQTNPEIKMLFMDINSLCKQFSKEFAQVCEFQESHRKRLQTYYNGKIIKQEETIKKLTQQLQSTKLYKDAQEFPFQDASYSLRSSQSYNRFSVPNTSRNSGTIYPDKQTGYFLQKPDEKMEVEHYSVKKNSETVAAPGRLSVISPPQDGRMGCVSYRSSSCSNTPLSVRANQFGVSQQSNAFHPLSKSSSQANRTSAWDPLGLRTLQAYQQSPLSSQASATRQPISLPNILHRQNLSKKTP